MANQELEKFSDKIGDIMNVLSEEEAVSLATTVSGGLLKNKINTRQDALKVILNHSEDVKSILRRKVFTREKLMSYLYENNVSLKLPVTKLEIIDSIIKLWTDNISGFELNDATNDSFEEVCDQDCLDEIPPVTNELQLIAETSNNDSVIKITEKNDDDDVQKTVRLLAEQFADWFYSLFNKNDLSQEHFFGDGILNLILVSNGFTNEKTVFNKPKDVTDTLLSIKNQYNLFFNPNLLTDSLKAKMDSHGLVMIIVEGTLHVNSVCVGVFEQMFSIARDPFAENNWKIKRTDLRLISGGSANNSEIIFKKNISYSSHTEIAE